MYRYLAATPEDLWMAFETVLYDEEFDLDDSITITQFMKSWTEQAGYPLVYIMKENNSLVISQVISILTICINIYLNYIICFE